MTAQIIQIPAYPDAQNTLVGIVRVSLYFYIHNTVHYQNFYVTDLNSTEQFWKEFVLITSLKVSYFSELKVKISLFFGK